MKNRKSVLITIIVLLVIFLPLTIIGFITNLNFDEKKVEENPNHEFFFEGHLWFYDNDNLLGTYECLTETCNLAKGMIDDDEYGVLYYKDGNKEEIDYDGSDYTILNDGVETFIYDIKNNKKFLPIEGIKTYNAILDDNLYIIKNNGKWGVAKIKNNADNDLRMLIPFEYEFIGLKNQLNEDNTLNTDLFIVRKINSWLLINQNQEEKSIGIDTPIIDYTNKFIISKKDDNYIIYDYEGNNLYSDYVINK